MESSWKRLFSYLPNIPAKDIAEIQFKVIVFLAILFIVYPLIISGRNRSFTSYIYA